MKRIGLALLLAGGLPLGEASAQEAVPGGPPWSVNPAPAAWRFQPSISFTYDSFGQRYTIADEDTLDLVDEMSGQLVTSLVHTGRTSVELKNMLGVGEEATRNDLLVSLRRRFGALDLRLTDDLRYKAYREHSDYGLSSDYLTNTARAIATWRLAGRWRLRIDDRFELADFAERTRYNYDYVRNDIGGEVERRYGILSTLRSGYSYGWRSVPDSTEIDYQRHLIEAHWDQEFGLHTLAVGQLLERRLYGDPTVRSHYVDYQTTMSFSASLRPELRLRPEYTASIITYDTPDSVYSDASEQSFELILERDLSDRTTLGVGPGGEFRRTNSSFDRAYNQWSLKGTLSYLAGSSLWVQFTNELGVRSYLAGDDILYSDYIFNWTTLYLSYEFVPRLTLDLFFSMNPESHDDEQNNTTTLLASTAITWGLR
ncbi:MAG: hypothetical protein ACE5G2_06545 [Candidatus Krumholzibacteriia bacterium]